MKGSRGRRRCASKDVGGQRGMRDKGDKAKVAGWVFESQYQEIVRNKGVHWKPGIGGYEEKGLVVQVARERDHLGSRSLSRNEGGGGGSLSRINEGQTAEGCRN